MIKSMIKNKIMIKIIKNKIKNTKFKSMKKSKNIIKSENRKKTMLI